MRNIARLGTVAALATIAVFAGVTSAQATPNFSATPSTGGTETIVTLADTANDMYDGVTGVVCSLDGQQDQHFMVSVDGSNPRTGTVNLVALPATGPWACNIYANVSNPSSAIGTFDYSYTGTLSVSDVTCAPALASTGTNSSSLWISASMAALMLAGGAGAMILVRSRRRKAAMFAIPLLLLTLGGTGLAIQPAQSAHADQPTGATVAVMPWIGVDASGGIVEAASIRSLTQWIDITDGCGALSYQWQGSDDGVTWQEIGSPTSEPTPTAYNGIDFPGGHRLEVTLTNSVGATVVYSNVLRPVG